MKRAAHTDTKEDPKRTIFGNRVNIEWRVNIEPCGAVFPLQERARRQRVNREEMFENS